MRLYRWNPVELKFLPSAAAGQAPAGARVLLTGLEMHKGQRVESQATTNERMFCLLRGSWRMNIGDNQLVVRRTEAVIIPPGFRHSAEAIEDSYALQMVSDQDSSGDFSA
jgi:mannose-6-phosphate isomerase-like protein (cupin superfamily)